MLGIWNIHSIVTRTNVSNDEVVIFCFFISTAKRPSRVDVEVCLFKYTITNMSKIQYASKNATPDLNLTSYIFISSKVNIIYKQQAFTLTTVKKKPCLDLTKARVFHPWYTRYKIWCCALNNSLIHKIAYGREIAAAAWDSNFTPV